MSTDITQNKDESKGPDLKQVKEALDKPVFGYADGAYKESDDHVPDPLFQTGYMDTSGTAGKADSKIEETSPIFEVARLQNMRNAARALDPEDEDVPSELVVLPQGSVTVQGTAKTAEEGRAEVFGAVLRGAENPPTIGGMSPAQRAAAEDTSDHDDSGQENESSETKSESPVTAAKASSGPAPRKAEEKQTGK